MDASELAEMLTALRRIGTESEYLEAKSGVGGLPRSVRETLVAFANTDGGTIVLGVDESAGFAVVEPPEIAKLRDGLVQMARDDITPPLRVSTEIVLVEGKRVLVAVVPRLPADQRPGYVTSQGIATGSYLRAGDGDRRMSSAELAITYASRTQPTYDREVVEGSTVADLDRGVLLRTLERVRAGAASLRDVDERVALTRLNIVSGTRDDAPLTVAGLLTFGVYPQQFFPQLMVSVVVHPGEESPSTRFLDNVTVRGSIPQMLSETLAVIRRNLAARAVTGDFGRVDRLDYPIEAIREAVANALLHRDYSPHTRGTQVQVELHPDRLVIRSPGGLYGGIVTEDLGIEGVSASRNADLASLLSDTYLPASDNLVVENRASGVPAMIRLARSSGLPRPVFRSSVMSFVVEMQRSQLLGPETRAWIRRLGVDLPTPTHEIALAMMRNGPISNATLREWGADRISAGQVLRDVVDEGLAIREGGRRYAQYVLDPAAASGPTRPGHGAEDLFSGLLVDTATALRRAGDATAAELRVATGRGRGTVQNDLNALIADGSAQGIGAPRSPKRRYRWTGEDNRRERS
ncbi:ATP-binding protein [Georgenia sp. MJ170]|uniref:ATP-binding protein n=1 Tax=Georgenia sunbinii TaxID=3117728 RepID=UPI002F26AC74